jgi:hypothetical protein
VPGDRDNHGVFSSPYVSWHEKPWAAYVRFPMDPSIEFAFSFLVANRNARGRRIESRTHERASERHVSLSGCWLFLAGDMASSPHALHRVIGGARPFAGCPSRPTRAAPRRTGSTVPFILN